MWIEMSRDNDHGGGSWGFKQCLWSPTRKKSNHNDKIGGRWSFWENLLKVKAGDQVLHLRGEGDTAAFVGFSTAQTDGYRTTARPPSPGQWSYATEYYRVLLGDFIDFSIPIMLKDIFRQENSSLRAYFVANKMKHVNQKKSIFYVVQANRLQCLNGAYLSEVDEELAMLLLGISAHHIQIANSTDISGVNVSYFIPSEQVNTGMQIRELGVRNGQQRFSANVRANYETRCAFPECTVDQGAMLIGAHIARWSDVPELRGLTSNGVCWCLIHDKAFEIGLYTISDDLCI